MKDIWARSMREEDGCSLGFVGLEGRSSMMDVGEVC